MTPVKNALLTSTSTILNNMLKAKRIYKQSEHSSTYKQSSAELGDLLSIQCCWLPGIHRYLHHPDHPVAGQSYEYSAPRSAGLTDAHHLSLARPSTTLCWVLADRPPRWQSSSRRARYQLQRSRPPVQPQTADQSQVPLYNNTTGLS